MSLKDVAKLAGVSASTVSRIVNGRNTSAASPETQKKIWDAVRTLGYSPNQNARSLRLPQAKASPVKRDIDCVYARMAGDHLDPFFTALMHAAEVEAFSAGYFIRYYHSAREIRREAFPQHDAAADSALVLGRADEEMLRMVGTRYRHVVCAGLNELAADFDQVISSGYEAAQKCVNYLITLGHTRICYMGEVENEQRFRGYWDAMSQTGLPDPMQYVVDTPFTPGGGYEAVAKVMRRAPDFTAIFCPNDMSAVGTLKALKEHRLKVPQDVSLIAINDMETSRYLDPMLTCIHIPLEEMGTLAAKVLIDRMEGGHKLPLKITVPNTLVRRDSCGPARERAPSPR